MHIIFSYLSILSHSLSTFCFSTALLSLIVWWPVSSSSSASSFDWCVTFTCNTIAFPHSDLFLLALCLPIHRRSHSNAPPSISSSNSDCLSLSVSLVPFPLWSHTSYGAPLLSYDFNIASLHVASRWPSLLTRGSSYRYWYPYESLPIHMCVYVQRSHPSLLIQDGRPSPHDVGWSRGELCRPLAPGDQPTQVQCSKLLCLPLHMSFPMSSHLNYVHAYPYSTHISVGIYVDMWIMVGNPTWMRVGRVEDTSTDDQSPALARSK